MCVCVCMCVCTCVCMCVCVCEWEGNKHCVRGSAGEGGCEGSRKGVSAGGRELGGGRE